MVRPSTGRRLALGVLFLMCTTAHGGYVDPVTAREWRQVTDTLLIARAEIAARCDAISGSCAGSVGTVLLDGWRWASVADVNELFTDFGVPGMATSAPTVSSLVAGSTWAPAFIDIDGAGPDAGAFDLTLFQSNLTGVVGFTRDLLTTDPTFAHLGEMLDATDPAVFDGARTNASTGIGARGGSWGFWMYRTVPEPATLPLALLAALCGVGLRRTRCSAA